MNKKIPLFLSSLLLFSFGCGKKETGLRVAATPVPHVQILQSVKGDLKAEGYNLIIVETEDYNVPNRSLANKEVDANFFQHEPFLQEQIKHFHYPIESIAKIELEPMGVYSTKLKSIDDLKVGAQIAIPNDPSNEARALLLLQSHGLIKLANNNILTATPSNIVSNPKQLKFIEISAPMLPRSLADVDAAVINTNYALEAHLSPTTDALLLENKNSPYANILVIRIGDETRKDIQALKKALTSEKTKKFIQETYHGAVIPAF